MKNNVLQIILPLMLSSVLGLSAQAATINVGGGCSLVDAITAANSDTATGGCPAGSGADTIELESSTTYIPTNLFNNADDGNSSHPSISSEIIINGNGSTILRVGGRVFHVAETIGSLTLNELIISFGTDTTACSEGRGGAVLNRGTLTINNSNVGGSYMHIMDCAQVQGGGIWNSGTLTLNNSAVNGNTAFASRPTGSWRGDDIDESGSGGGIWNSGTLRLSNSTVKGNKTHQSGGGIWNSGTVMLINSTVEDNSASGKYAYEPYPIHTEYDSWKRTVGSGGGIWNSGTLTLINSLVRGNKTDNGGGGISNSGTLTLSNSTITDNSAFGFYRHSFRKIISWFPYRELEFDGNTPKGSGGGISNSGTLTLTNSTVVGNDVKVSGGGIKNSNSMTLLNSIIANSLNGGDCINEGTLSSTNNLIEDGTCSSAFSPGTAPNLGPLQDNGGPTQTYALLLGSPAIDAGTNDACPDTDQRGVTRPINGTCDIGAYEYQGIPTYVELLSLTATGSYHPEFNLYYADIQWQTGLERDTNHFEILKSAQPEGPYQAIRIWYYDGEYYQTDRISAQGEAWKYRVFDPEVSAGETYYYQLKEVDIYGISTKHGPVSATMP